MNQPVITTERLSKAQIDMLLATGLSASSATPDSAALCRSAAQDASGRKLKTLLADLQSPLNASGGPLSFARLTGLDDAEASRLAGRTLFDLLISAATDRRLLEKLADYGRLLLLPAFPQSTRLTGAAVRALALGALRQRHAAEVDPDEAVDVEKVLAALATTEVLGNSIRGGLRGPRPG